MNPVAGFRWWILSQGKLVGMWGMYAGGNTAWKPGLNVASCRRLPFLGAENKACEFAPARNHTCGLYGHYRFSELDPPRLPALAWVCGLIAAWGDVYYHENAFRAEKATIIGFLGPPLSAPGVHEAALLYDVPVVESPAALVHLARERDLRIMLNGPMGSAAIRENLRCG
jgi:hypothetical protein